MNEATARIKINKLLEEAGWRFFAENGKPANILLEPGTSIRSSDLDALGNDFERTEKGFIDFLLLDDKGRPCIVLEAKSEDKQPLVGKEQARKYARSQNCRFVLLSNGNLHYFWDLERGNPYVITSFPTPDSAADYRQTTPDPQRLVKEPVSDDYIVLTQRPGYAAEAGWKIEDERPAYIQTNNLSFLRDYQLDAVHALQRAVKDGKDRFLFEMATGTGKTLTAAAVIKLFLRSGNACRVLFLVDRLELEEQARKVFNLLLSNDFQTVIYKENRADWRRAEIVVTTVQSLLFNNKYQQLFSPTDFDFVISDEAHRSIGGNARAVFDYFVGYKLGLTATPRDYLKGVATSTGAPSGPSDSLSGDAASTGAVIHDPREVERRLLLDTYRTFGCESGQPTFRYSLLDGVRDGVLVNPTVVDARTNVTTQLLSDEGYVATFTDDTGEDQEETYKQREFEKRFFSEATNALFCKTFLENALVDPVSKEIGKSIIFAVSQNHAAKLTQLLNQMADRMFPGKYQSDFAAQVTSQVADARQFTINFANNNLLGTANFLPDYRTSKARVCVTVGMMTTGYDCPDILNLGLFRPIFSPTDFIQIKGRGTRKHDFLELLFDEELKDTITEPQKAAFKLFDFFGNCEYFETEFNYDEVLALPKPGGKTDPDPEDGLTVNLDAYEHLGQDIISSMEVQTIGAEGMKIDFSVQSKRSEVLFVDYIAEHLTPNGRAGIIVPEGIIFQSQNAYKNLRKMLVEDYLVAVISLPAGVFNPYSGVKTSILLLDKTLAKKTDRIAFFKVENDGFDLGAQRREIDKNDLPRVKAEIVDYLERLRAGETAPGTGVAEPEAKYAGEHSQPASGLIAGKDKIAEGGEYNLGGERYRERDQISDWPLAALGEIANDIKAGFACGKSAVAAEGVPHIRPMNITETGQFTWNGLKRISNEDYRGRESYALVPGDILFNNTNSKELVGKTCHIHQHIKGGYSNHITRIRINNGRCMSEFVAYTLHAAWQNGEFHNRANKWIGQAGINTKSLSRFQIPLPPLEVQREIVAEIEGYQKVIDGARTVVENYEKKIQATISRVWGDNYQEPAVTGVKNG